MKKVYIIGSTKGVQAFDRFKAAEQEFDSKGYIVKNIYKHFTPGACEDEVQQRLKLLLDCDAVLVLADWSEHEFSLLEFHTAIATNMNVIRANNTIIPERYTIYTK